jgi:putative Mg2+ transporter-C (MgtC) family protein
MPLNLSWQEMALRLVCTLVAGILIGINRDEKGRAAGMRTNVLVCLAAAIAMLQANLLMPTTGKASDSFVVLDLMRLPLGILSGIGFIGAGAILRRDDMVVGVTTAATIWIVTVLGLCFGGGQIILGVTGTVLAIATLWGLKWFERRMDHQHRGHLTVTLKEETLSESDLRARLLSSTLHIHSWEIFTAPETRALTVKCELRWRRRAHDYFPPQAIQDLRRATGVTQLNWQE